MSPPRTSGRLRLAAPIALCAIAALVAPACVSKGEFERMKEEIAAAKGDIDRLQRLAAVQAQELKLSQATVDSLKEEIAQLRAAAAPQQAEKAQNKQTGAKPKTKKKKK